MSDVLTARPATLLLAGRVRVPGDKSIGHRALLFGALASGTCEVSGLGGGEDNARTRRAVEMMGARVAVRGPDAVAVTGVGVDGLSAPASVIDCGNSGTSMRLLCGLLAGQRFAAELCGDESLSKRPMRRVIDPLAAMGAQLTGQPGPKAGESYPPLRVGGVGAGRRLSGIDYALPVASAQVKSAVLLAGLYAEGVTTVREPGPTRDHTERMLAYLGAPLTQNGAEARVDPRSWGRRLEARPLVVPGDPSSAAFLVAAALLAGGEEVVVEGVCVNSTRIGFLDALAAMGAEIEQRPAGGGAGGGGERGAEPMADLVVRAGRHAPLDGAVLSGELVVRAIDEIPILAVLAGRARGTTEIRDASELRVKESDRIATTAAMLRALGVEVEERPDGMVIEGRNGRPFRGAAVDAVGDHRIAMSAAIAGLGADSEVRIRDAGNVRTSFPTFADVLGKLGGDISWD